MRKILTAICLLNAGSFAVAAPADWEAGKQAYVDGNYELALQYFVTAKNDGLDGPAVLYNLAVCNFKLARYEESSVLFQVIASRYPKMRGLAEYNLGLIARRQNDVESAVGHFLEAYRLSPGEAKLQALASNRLRELEPKLRPGTRWTGALSLRPGFDDNVGLRDETGLSPTLENASAFGELFVSVQSPYIGSSGFRVNGGVYAVRNFDASEFDQTELFGGVGYEWRAGDWQMKVGLHTSAGSLGGDGFDRKIGSDFSATRFIDQYSEFSVIYAYDDIGAEEPSFAGIAGSRQQLQARYRWYNDSHRFDLRLRHEDNDRLNASVSPKRSSVLAKYGYQFESGWGNEVNISYRRSHFDEMTVPRIEDLSTLGGAITRSFGRNWLVFLEYQYAHNDSSDSTYTFDRNVFSIGVLKSF